MVLAKATKVLTQAGAFLKSPRTKTETSSSPRRTASPRSVRITVSVPGPLRDCCGGVAELALSAANPRAVLAEIERLYPKLHRSICDETGALRPHINLFVNNDHMREREGLDTPLAPSDLVTVMTAVSGG